MSHDPGPGLSYALETQVALTLARFPCPCPLLLSMLHCNKTRALLLLTKHFQVVVMGVSVHSQ